MFNSPNLMFLFCSIIAVVILILIRSLSILHYVRYIDIYCPSIGYLWFKWSESMEQTPWLLDCEWYDFPGFLFPVRRCLYLFPVSCQAVFIPVSCFLSGGVYNCFLFPVRRVYTCFLSGSVLYVTVSCFLSDGVIYI